MNALAEMVRKQLIAGNIRLPALPESMFEVKKILDDEEKGAADIAKVIKSDQALSTAVIRIANSSRFNSRGIKTSNLPMAIQRIGGKRTFEVLIAISSKVLLQVKDKQLQENIRKSFQHAQAVAVASQEIARCLRDPASEEAFLAGFIHDIGLPAVICAVPDELLALSVHERESVLDSLHREVGGRLLAMWGMPSALIEIASYHELEGDDRPSGKLIDYVDAANFLVNRMKAAALGEAECDFIQSPAIARLGMSEAVLISVEMEVEEAVEELQSVMSF